MDTVFLFLATGFEEIEALSVVDVLRRGGVDVQTVSITENREVTGAHGISVIADQLLKKVSLSTAACLIFPGGMPGAQFLSESEGLMSNLQLYYQEQQGMIAAICAAPALVLGKLNLGRKYKLTCYPGFESLLIHHEIVEDGVVVDDRIVTAKGPAFAVDFGLMILSRLTSSEITKKVAAGMLK